MYEHDLLNLFDSLWSETPIFTAKPSSLPVRTTTQISELDVIPEKSKLSGFLATPHVRSMSEADVTVLSSTPIPQTVLPERASGEFFLGAEDSSFVDVRQEMKGSPRKKSESGTRTRRKKKQKQKQKQKQKKGIVRTSSRSPSELEFQELKGFMDLGFVFSERDRDSDLISIIPGLQWIGIKGGGSEREGEGGISRPYLSEAWGLSEAKPVMKWKIPEMGNDEKAMKDHLRFWAHAIADAVG